MKQYKVTQMSEALWNTVEDYDWPEDEILVIEKKDAYCMDITANGKRIVPILRKIEKSMTDAGLAGESGVYAGWFGEWANSLTDRQDRKHFIWSYSGRQDIENGCWSYSWGIEQIDDDRWYIFLNIAKPQEDTPSDNIDEYIEKPTETTQTTNEEQTIATDKEETKMTYLEQIKEDIMEAIKSKYSMDEIMEKMQDRDSFEEELNDDLWIDDSVTGNGSGSYTMDRAKAQEYVLADIETVQEALREFCIEAETIAKKFLESDWEYFDVTARCYVLGMGISEVLDEIEAKAA